jgi:hypothetical protein
MPSILTRILLFLSSYFPLSVIFFFLLLSKHRPLAIAILGVGGLGLVGISVYFRLARRINPTRITVAAVQRRDAEAMSYIVSYVIPFLAIPFQGVEEAISLGVFFLVIGILYVNSNLIHINPMLNLSGYHLYEISVESGATYSLITHREVIRGETLSAVKASNGIFLETRQ